MLVDRAAAMALERVQELDAGRERRLSERLAAVDYGRDEIVWRATECAIARVRDLNADRDSRLEERLEAFVGMDSLMANQSETWDPERPRERDPGRDRSIVSELGHFHFNLATGTLSATASYCGLTPAASARRVLQHVDNYAKLALADARARKQHAENSDAVRRSAPPPARYNNDSSSRLRQDAVNDAQAEVRSRAQAAARSIQNRKRS